MTSDEVGVAQERLERPVAEDVVGDLLRDPGAVGTGHDDVGRGDGALQGEADVALQLALRHVDVVELGAERRDELGVHDALDVLERVAGLASAAPWAACVVVAVVAGAFSCGSRWPSVRARCAAASLSVRPMSGLPQSESAGGRAGLAVLRSASASAARAAPAMELAKALMALLLA